MTDEDILIAKFMGFRVKFKSGCFRLFYPDGQIFDMRGFSEEEIWQRFKAYSSYDYDWNSLMPVVNKLTVEHNLIIKFHWCTIRGSYIAYVENDDMIINNFSNFKGQFKCVYKMVIECIKFVNKHEGK